MSTRAVRNRSAPMPSARWPNRFDSNTPPPASGRNATVIATCTTITVVQNPPNRSPERAALSLRSASCTLRFVTRSAGRMPTIAAPNRVSTAAYSTVFSERPSSIQYGVASPAENIAMPERSAMRATTSPTIAATPVSTSASTNSCDDDARAARAERVAHRDLPAARRGAREHERRDVRADDRRAA